MKHKILSCLPLFLLLAGCGEEPKPATKEPAKAPEPATAQSAAFKIFSYARGQWATDAKVLRVRDIKLKEVPATAGKSGAWEVTLVSERTMKIRLFTWSAIEAGGNLHQGVFAGVDQGWSGPSGQAKPFLMQAFKVDSTAAYETAMKQKTAQEYVKKHPDTPITFVLELTRFPNPAWRVIWGESAATSNFSIYVDATTGAYLETAR